MTAGLDWNLDTESLEVDNRRKDDNSSDQVHDVGEILPVESLLQSTGLVGPGQKEMEERNNGTLELWTTSSVDGSWAECPPDDVLANIGGNEERDTRAQSVTLLKQLIEKDHNKTSNDKLEDEQQAHTSTKVRGLSIKSSQNVNGGLSERENDRKDWVQLSAFNHKKFKFSSIPHTLLSSLVKFTVRLEIEVDINKVGTSKKLHMIDQHLRDQQPPNW